MKIARSALAKVILSVGLIFGYVAVTSYLVSQSLFRQGRLANAAHKIISNPIVQNDISNAITSSISSSIGNIPANAGTEINVALRSVFATQGMQNIFTNVLSLAQARLMGQNVGTITIGGPSLTTPLSQALQPVDPGLANSIKNAPLQVNIPGTSVPNLGTMNRALPRVERDAAEGALICIALALLISPKRFHILRRIGFAAIGFSFLNAFFFWLLPTYILPLTGYSWTPVASVVLSALGGPAIATMIILLIAGIGLVIVSTVL